jgi:RNA polymerase sigma-70 factor, ECF subfamily
LKRRGGRRVPLDEAEIREFLRTDYRRLVAGLSLLGGSRALAEEAVQEALARAWEQDDRGEHIESLKAWVSVVATNLLRSSFRRLLAEARAMRRLGRPQEGAPASGEHRSEDRVDLHEAIRALPRRQRRVVVLRYFADMSLEEIATFDGTTTGAVKSMLHRARAALGTVVGVSEPEEVNDGARRG